MAKPDFDAALRAFIAKETRRRLAPHLPMLRRAEKLLQSLEQESVSKSTPRALQVEPAVPTPVAHPSIFRVGQSVRYHWKDKDFEAIVIALDPGSNSVVLERVKDGKRVSRPESKVTET